MHDAKGVRLGEGFARLDDVVASIANRKRSALANELAKITALEKFHHEVRRAALEAADVDHARDVLALDLGGGARLTRKSGNDLRHLERGGEKEFDRDLLVEV